MGNKIPSSDHQFGKLIFDNGWLLSSSNPTLNGQPVNMTVNNVSLQTDVRTDNSTYSSSSASTTFTLDGICNKSQYQKEILEKINEAPLEDMALLINDKDPLIRKLAELRLAANK